MPTGRLAWRILHGPVHGSIWYRWAVRCGVFASTLVLLAVVASLNALFDQQSSTQHAIISVEDGVGDVWVLPANDLVVDDHTLRVFWIEPVGSNPSAIPLGLTAIPAPGSTAVSPALYDLIDTQPALRATVGPMTLIGRDGLESRGDLIAWARPPEGRSIASRAYRIASFSTERPAGVAGLVINDGLSTRPVELILGAVGLVLGPVLVVLVVVLNLGSPSRTYRLQVMVAIGASRAFLISLWLMQHALLTVPAIVLACLVWQIWARGLETMPVVDQPVFSEQLVLSWAQLLLVAMATVLMIAAATLIALRIARPKRQVSRPTSSFETLTPLRLAPLGFTVVSLLAFLLNRTPLSEYLLLVGLALSVVSVPALAPSLLRPVGVALRSLPFPSLRIASGALILQPVRRARPFLAFAALITLAFIGSAYVSLISTESSSTPGPDISLIDWPDPAAGDLVAISNALPSAMVIPVSFGRDGLKMGTTCEDLERAILGIDCGDEALSEGSPAQVVIGPGSPLTRFTQGIGGGVMLLVPAEDLQATGQAMSIHPDPRDVDGESLLVAGLSVPGGSVLSTLALKPRSSPVLPWLRSGLALAFALLGVAVFFALVDSVLTSSGARRHLIALGVTPGRLAGIEAAIFAVPAMLVAGLGVASGATVYGMLVAMSFDITYSWDVFFNLSIFTVAIISVGTALVALASTTYSYREG